MLYSGGHQQPLQEATIGASFSKVPNDLSSLKVPKLHRDKNNLHATSEISNLETNQCLSYKHKQKLKDITNIFRNRNGYS